MLPQLPFTKKKVAVRLRQVAIINRAIEQHVLFEKKKSFFLLLFTLIDCVRGVCYLHIYWFLQKKKLHIYCVIYYVCLNYFSSFD